MCYVYNMHTNNNHGSQPVPDFIKQIGQESADKYSQNRRFGNWGEGIVCEMLKSEKGMKILDRNFLRKCGELDIVAEKDGTLHFIEVKTVTREITTYDGLVIAFDDLQAYNPLDHVDRRKMLRMKRTISVYLAEKHVSHETPFQIDVASVVFFMPNMLAQVEFLENIIE